MFLVCIQDSKPWFKYSKQTPLKHCRLITNSVAWLWAFLLGNHCSEGKLMVHALPFNGLCLEDCCIAFNVAESGHLSWNLGTKFACRELWLWNIQHWWSGAVHISKDCRHKFLKIDGVGPEIHPMVDIATCHCEAMDPPKNLVPPKRKEIIIDH